MYTFCRESTPSPKACCPLLQINGCADVEVSADEMLIVDCNVYSLSTSAVVEEEGTGIQLSDSKSTSITRSAVSFKTLYKDEFMKPNLPYSLKVRSRDTGY